MTYSDLSDVFRAMGVNPHNYKRILTARAVLHHMRFETIPLYVVVVAGGSVSVVSDYMVAMHLFDNYGARVFGVWRDDECMWHVVEQ